MLAACQAALHCNLGVGSNDGGGQLFRPVYVHTTYVEDPLSSIISEKCGITSLSAQSASPAFTVLHVHVPTHVHYCMRLIMFGECRVRCQLCVDKHWPCCPRAALINKRRLAWEDQVSTHQRSPGGSGTEPP